jgi:hypothetical protein
MDILIRRGSHIGPGGTRKEQVRLANLPVRKCPWCGNEYPAHDVVKKCPACGGDLTFYRSILAKGNNIISMDGGDDSGVS